MIVLKVRNVHEALPEAMKMLDIDVAVREPSRNGDVVRMPCPVATVYARPEERVEFHEWRDSNPFFHFYESLWMLAGRQDVAPLARYVERMKTFSDDGETFNAAYGYRWRHADVNGDRNDWRSDQLKIICDILKSNPTSRQCVLQIWDHRLDLGTQTKDHACNVAATFQISNDTLDMSLFCRSNDVIWGALGANAVHFSVLMEYVARRVGVMIGTMTQISVNWHAYEKVYRPMLIKCIADDHKYLNPYTYVTQPVHPYPLAKDGCDFEKWDADCAAFVTKDGRKPELEFLDRDGLDPFFSKVAWPIIKAHDLYKTLPDSSNREDRWQWIFDTIDCIEATDWQLACRNWMTRRKESRK